LSIIFYFPLEYFCARYQLILMIRQNSRDWGSVEILFDFLSSNLVGEASYLQAKHLVFLLRGNLILLHHDYLNLYLHNAVSCRNQSRGRR